MPTPASPKTIASCGSPAVDRALVRVAKGVELVTASDERPLVGAAGPDRRQRPDEQPAGDGLALPLRVDVLQLAELERAPGRLRGPLAHDDLAGVRSLLEARAHVHGVPGDERAVRVGVDDHLAGVHADPQRKRRVELGETFAHRERGMERTLRVVLQRRGSAERRHHRVAGELLDGAARPARPPRPSPRRTGRAAPAPTRGRPRRWWSTRRDRRRARSRPSAPRADCRAVSGLGPR